MRSLDKIICKGKKSIEPVNKKNLDIRSFLAEEKKKQNTKKILEKKTQ